MLTLAFLALYVLSLVYAKNWYSSDVFKLPIYLCTLYRAPTCTFFFEYFLMNYRQVIVFSRPAMHNKRFFFGWLCKLLSFIVRELWHIIFAHYIFWKSFVFLWVFKKNLNEFVLKVGIGWPRWLGKWLMWKDRRRERKMG